MKILEQQVWSIINCEHGQIHFSNREAAVEAQNEGYSQYDAEPKKGIVKTVIFDSLDEFIAYTKKERIRKAWEGIPVAERRVIVRALLKRRRHRGAN
jgi:hypothetical protein